MGYLKNLEAKRKRAEKSGVKYIPTSLLNNREIVYMSSVILHQSGTDLHIGKNRWNFETGFQTLPVVIDTIVKEYMNCDLNEILTPVAFFNEPIKEELEYAIRKVLDKHGIKAKA